MLLDQVVSQDETYEPFEEQAIISSLKQLRFLSSLLSRAKRKRDNLILDLNQEHDCDSWPICALGYPRWTETVAIASSVHKGKSDVHSQFPILLDVLISVVQVAQYKNQILNAEIYRSSLESQLFPIKQDS